MITPDTATVLTRRAFLGGSITLVCAAPIASWLGAGCGGPAGARDIDGWIVPPGTKLSPERYAALAALLDVLVPGDAQVAGATEAHAAWYLDQLLGAFDVDPPRIYAGGPYSGRHGGMDGFSSFQPLTRVEELRWRTYLEGSRGIPEREWNGPVAGILEQYEQGLDALDRQARQSDGKQFTALAAADRQNLVLGLDDAFRDMAYGHAVEGTYGDPVYGGNYNLVGWQAIDYEGDRQPIGYTARQMATAEEV